jgi:1,4-alpha-glucan branching enzyme
MFAIRNAVMHRYSPDAIERVIYTESHDEVANGKARIPEEVDPGKASSRLAKKMSALGALLLFTSPGIPMLFQGQEFLEDDWFHDKDPIDWAKRDRFKGILQLYKDLILLRLNRSGVSQGLLAQEVDAYLVNQNDKIIAYHRWASGGPMDSVVLVANFSGFPRGDYEIGLPDTGTWMVRFNSDSRYYDQGFDDFGSSSVYAESPGKDGLPAHGKVHVGAYSGLILSQDKQ